MKVLPFLLGAAPAVRATFWMEDLHHHGISPFNPDEDYMVFRNIKDYGATGDGGTLIYFRLLSSDLC